METVKLTRTDLETLADCCDCMIQYKQTSLKKANWSTFEADYLPKLIEYFKKNEWVIRDYNNSIFTWLIDNICHSRKLIEGVKLAQCTPLADTALGEAALEILRHAKTGQVTYDNWCQGRAFRNLFTPT